jgi:hypothetical protein
MSDAGLRSCSGTPCAFLIIMMISQASILLGLGVAVLGGCVADGHGVDVDPDLISSDDADDAGDVASDLDRRPRPGPGPDPGSACRLIGGPATAAAILGAVDYEVTGGPSGSGNGTWLEIAEIGSLTRHTTERGTEEGLLDGLTHYGLYRKVITADIPRLCRSYSCDGCTGDYIHKLTVYLDGAPYTVEVGFRASPPERLVALINTVQNITTRPLP